VYSIRRYLNLSLKTGKRLLFKDRNLFSFVVGRTFTLPASDRALILFLW
jgi:hypothetical protein